MKNFIIDGIDYISLYSNEIDEKLINDFINICNTVFGEGIMNNEKFKRKYINNIYGNSIIVIGYKDNLAIAARGFWRNDLNSAIAYQPSDTCVLKDFRGKGIFKHMTKIALDMLEEIDIVYNFPNKESYAQYIKLGWKDLYQYFPVIYYSFKKYKDEFSDIINDEYLKWWIIPRKDEGFYFKKVRGERYLLLKEIKKRNIIMFRIIGEINKEMCVNFNEVKRSGIITYYSRRKTIYNQRAYPYKVIGINVKDIIPLHKIDAI